MERRRAIQIGLAVALVCVLSLSGLIAEQAFSESQARGQYLSAQRNVHSELTRARQMGLYAGEISPFQRQAAQLDSGAAPSTVPFWRSQSTTFYERRTAAYQRLIVRLHHCESQVTASARVGAVETLTQLKSGIAAATSLGLAPSAAQSGLQKETVALHNADRSDRTPGAYRAISAAVKPLSTSLTSSVAAQRARLNAILASANNSVAGVTALARSEATGASQTLDLLSLLTARATQYRAKLNGLLTAVQSQQDPTQSAVREAALHDEIGVVQADAAKTIPAKMIVVSTEDQYAHVYQDGKDIYTTPVTTGGPELPTDHGVFHIYEKISPFVFHSPWPPGSPYYYPPTPVEYWMPFYEAEGLHDASWRSNFGPGSNFQPTDLGTGNYILGTHGCVNLPTPAAAFIWNWAPVGTTVVVT